MRKTLLIFLALVSIVVLCACTPEEMSEEQSLTVVQSFEKGTSGEDHIWTAYYKMSDGTWKTDTHAYKYCLELSGKAPGAGLVWEFIVLSNREDLTFDDVFWASGFSSDSSAYFSPEDAVIVRTNFNVSG